VKGLFNKVRNSSTRKRFVVSTIRKDDHLFETAVFEATFLYFPKSLSRPVLLVETPSKDEAWALHYRLADRLAEEYPLKLFQEYSNKA
jgi:hypothetical protein